MLSYAGPPHGEKSVFHHTPIELIVIQKNAKNLNFFTILASQNLPKSKKLLQKVMMLMKKQLIYEIKQYQVMMKRMRKK